MTESTQAVKKEAARGTHPWIVCAADDAYAMPLAVTLSSLCIHYPSTQPLQLAVIDGDISSFNKERIEASLHHSELTLRWIYPERDRLTGLKVDIQGSIAPYFRLLIPELLPQECRLALYLDCDLVVNSSVIPLLQCTSSYFPVYAAQDRFSPTVGSPYGLPNFEELGLAEKVHYFNTGVLVYNLPLWRTEKISAQILEYLAEHKEHVRWWDQDGLNAVLSRRWGILDPAWNHMVSPLVPLDEGECEKLSIESASTNYRIVHFATAHKPWHPGYEHAAKNLFYHYLDNTAWAGWRPHKLNPARVLERVRSLYPSKNT